MLRSPPALSASVLAAMCCMLAACGSPATPTGNTSNGASSNGALPGTTTWDFALLAGPDGPQGNPKIFTLPGQGAIIATVIEAASNPGFQVWSKGFNDPPLSPERGLGICGDYGTGGICGSVGPAASDEIGDTFPDSAGNLTLTPSMVLNFTGLSAGSVVDSVTLGSLEFGEGYSVLWSADGVTYTQMVRAARVTGTSNVVAFPVPAGVNYLRFDQGPGIAVSDYVVVTVHVVLPKH
jgi:hypothetical protein